MKIFVEEFLSLESVSVADATETYAIIDNQREYFKKWLPWVDYNTNVDDSATNIKSCMQKNDAGTKQRL
jgi:ribosomal-protein-serine acetyltransferase